jgi:hypothetical protein
MSGDNFHVAAGTKSPRAIYHPRGAAMMTLMAAELVFVADRGCVVMIAAPLYQTAGLHSVSVCCRPGGNQMPVVFLRQLLIF